MISRDVAKTAKQKNDDDKNDDYSGNSGTLTIYATCAISNICYPQDTTNTIEGFNRQLQIVTKSVFPTVDSLFKMLHLAMVDITRKWTGRRQDWSIIHAQLSAFFAGRMPE